MEQSLGLPSSSPINLMSKKPLQMISEKRVISQTITMGRSPFILQRREQLRHVRAITTVQRMHPARFMQQLAADVCYYVSVGWHPKILNNRKQMRATSAQGIMNLACDCPKRRLVASYSQNLLIIVMEALHASAPTAIASNASVEIPSQEYQPRSSQSRPSRQRRIVRTMRTLCRIVIYSNCKKYENLLNILKGPNCKQIEQKTKQDS